MASNSVSTSVIKRLPRYYRFLGELMLAGTTRISSRELSEKTGLTASQIRQDLNCFGGFGQQGYGYNVNYLFAKISEILGVGAGFHAVIIGAGDLGRGLVHQSMFEKRGVDILAMFDTGEGIVGQNVAGIEVLALDKLEEFCATHQVDIAVLTCPKELVRPISDRLVTCKVKGLWNYMGVELGYTPQEIVVENVHLGDSLMILNYKIASRYENRTDEERAELVSSEDSISDLSDNPNE